MNEQVHQPVLAEAIVQLLNPKPGQAYLDLTAGYGGHASLILEQLSSDGRAVLVDRDESAIDHLRARFKGDSRVNLLHDDYLSASQKLVEAKQKFDLILADIGVSSPHLDNPDRGFSFMNEGPLDMRMDTRTLLTAADIVNTWKESEIANLLYRYGEVRGSRKLAREIVQHRPYLKTSDLSAIITGNPRNLMRIRAQVFQALRIVVNDELTQLEASLPLWAELLNKGGKLAVISFHSLEDRIVKQYFVSISGDRFDSEFTLCSKRPVVAEKNEIVLNPRARSAKLRVAQRK